MLIQIAQLCCSSEASPLVMITKPRNSSEAFKMTPHFQERILEHETMTIKDDEDELLFVPENEKIASPVLPKVSEKVSLSMGNIISSLNIDVTSMILSKDKKIAFATLDFDGTLKIIDISDLQAPAVLGSLSLRLSSFTFELTVFLSRIFC